MSSPSPARMDETDDNDVSATAVPPGHGDSESTSTEEEGEVVSAIKTTTTTATSSPPQEVEAAEDSSTPSPTPHDDSTMPMDDDDDNAAVAEETTKADATVVHKENNEQGDDDDDGGGASGPADMEMTEAVTDDTVSPAGDDAKAAAATEEKGDRDETTVTNNTNPPSLNQKPGEKLTSYSTRGRTQDSAMEKLATAAGSDLLLSSNNNKPSNELPSTLHSPDTRMRESFLSDSLTEEERRTRTRYLPQVEGMHALRKAQIKGDLALARAIAGAHGHSGNNNGKSSKRKHRDSSAEDSGEFHKDDTQDDGGGFGVEEDRVVSDTSRSQSTFEFGAVNLQVPSMAFVAPVAERQGSTPRQVEAIAAFNPPRPPESMGPKKKHRMLRWERRPADIEVDLTNYRKTVSRTRAELTAAQQECDRLISVDNLLRRNFLQNIRCLQQETKHIGEEMAKVQQNCLDCTDVQSNRTRTRGAVKGSTVMRDVLATLRAKSREIERRGLSLPTKVENTVQIPGAGGVSAVSFTDWDRSTNVQPTPLARAWILPGDKVDTPFGEGTAVSIFGPSPLNIDEEPPSELMPKKSENSPEDAMDIDTSKPTETTKKKKKKSKGKHGTQTVESLKTILAPRVAVRLSFGVAFFNFDVVKSKENPSIYTDDQLARRMNGLVQTAQTIGGIVDVGAMAGITSSGAHGMDVEFAGDETMSDTDVTDEQKGLVSFGAGMFPTSAARGALMSKASVVSLDRSIEKSLFQRGHTVLGVRDNNGVSKDFRRLEDERQKQLDLQARVLQLRNQLYRQRRIRILNERTYTSTQERASRVESLVAEMRMDLKSLKGRLDLEIRDLGVSEKHAESILTSFYMSLDSQHAGEASPPKRSRRLSRMDGSMDDIPGISQDSEAISGNSEAGLKSKIANGLSEIIAEGATRPVEESI